MKSPHILFFFLLLEYDVLCIVKNINIVTKPTPIEEKLNWAAFNENYNGGQSNEFKGTNKQYQKHLTSSIHEHNIPSSSINNENSAEPPLWDGENCPSKTTGIFPVTLDCRKFLNCFKGRGFIQSCSPGTLFNPETLECDFPSKVRCLNGNPSKVDSLTLNKNPDQHFETNTQSMNRGISHNNDTNVPLDYGKRAGGGTPLYGSDFVVNGYNRSQDSSGSTQPFVNYKTNLNSKNIYDGQVLNSNNPTNTEPLNSNINYLASLQQKPSRLNNNQFTSQGQSIPNSDLSNSQFTNQNPISIGHQNNIGSSNNPESNKQYENKNIFREEKYNQPQNKVRFSFPKELSYPTQRNNNFNNEYTNPAQLSPNSWMRNQLKGKQGSTQNAYSHVYEKESLINPVPESQLLEPASSFDLGNQQQVVHNDGYDPIIEEHNSHGYNQKVPLFNAHNYNKGLPNSDYQPSTQFEPIEQLPDHELSSNKKFNSKTDSGYVQSNKFEPVDQYQPLHLTSNNRRFNDNSNVYPVNPQPNTFEQQRGFSHVYDGQVNGNSKTATNQFRIIVPNVTELEQQLLQKSPLNKDAVNNRSSNGKLLFNESNGEQYTNQNEFSTRFSDKKFSSSQDIPSTDSTKIKCQNGFNGIQLHPNDCSKFLSCANGRTFVMDCGPGTLFNPTISVCDHPYNVQCNRIIETTTTAEINNYNPDLDVRGIFDQEAINGDSLPQTENPENQAVLETLPAENRQLKILRNPSSIDLLDNHLSNTSIIHTPNNDVSKKVENNVSVRIDLKPNSTQSIRLRGGLKHFEGFLQVQEKPFQWGVVCDEPNSWTIDKADIVCRQLGFNRGAEQTWQGLTVTTDNPTKLLRIIGVTKVSCNGQESVFHNCKLQNDKTCNVERDAVWIKCRINSGSRCQPEEVTYDDKCYKLFVPVSEKLNKGPQDIGFSKVEALEHCQKRGGSLLDISSQRENDFVSEWLLRQKSEGPILTSGVGVSVLGNPIWIWEGTNNAFVYQNWWPGWEFKKPGSPVIKSNRALCIVLQKSFPCPSNPNSTKLCDSEYYHWEAIDCGTKTERLSYVCERNADDIGCINGAGSDYNGSANTTASGNKCLSWDDATVLAAMKYRVSEKTRRSMLTKHNKCRNPDGTDLQPWCYVQSSVGLVRSEFCDITTCNTASKSISGVINQKTKCDANFFECQPNECINHAWVCDNQADCSNGNDEKNCSNTLDNFSKTPEARLQNHEVEKWLHTTVYTCANRCTLADGFVCRSFSHSEVDQTCVLSDGVQNDTLSLEPHKDWDYYEANNPECLGKFVCDNGNCIDKQKECDGHNDCGDRSDERNCTSAKKMMGYEIRLAGGNSTNEGRVEVKVLGEWGVICDDKFDMREADVICRELGFPSSVSVKSNSFFGIPNKTRFVLDDLECRGDEKSLYSCQFKEWGIHDCNAQESAGVICRTAGGKNCSSEEFECKSGECIPMRFICDSFTDCTDGSDESPQRCNSPLEIRLVGGNERRAGLEGRVEVRQYGIWGTVCDDDFGTKEAFVICNHLGYKGHAEFKKDAAFGPGLGQIWLDQVRCLGNETSIEHCFHAKWGQHNCKHDEDVSVICHLDRKKKDDNISPKNASHNVKTSKEYLPTQCGKKTISLQINVIQKRISSGFTSERGSHPWQASIRSNTPAGQMEHVCGAVIISKFHILTAAHCVRDLDKDAYYVRVGDYDIDLKEDSEQDFYIDEIYNHEQFEEGSIKLNNDIAVIKLKTNGIQFNQYVQPVCLPSKNTKLKHNLNCTITGWGSDGSIGSSFAKTLRWATVPIIEPKICKADYVYGKLTISDGMFCAGNLDGGVDACQGDSGGPLVCNTDSGETVMGITSWGYGCGRANSPGVYSNISYYQQWLDKTLLYSMTV
ncbi:uncharacterized protein LOC126838845 isoform X3 [Adelges cooleyi]|uniref:uncharacterized protein LOC126838845 isoform X3 n=1 Tax=Adelges cooleyi TaxID=133065 RepID=UPI002180910D|nr:uncharacterized protein LOC126838845 isoform X3 [Adelges cooleyi]